MTIQIKDLAFKHGENALTAEFLTSVQRFLHNGDFLHFTLANPVAIESSFHFVVSITEDSSPKMLVGNHSQNVSINVEVLDTGIIIFEPTQFFAHNEGDDLIISSGVHGNETAPIEICSEFITQLLSGQIALAQRVMFIFGNPCAINKGTRFVEKNLNSLFSGDALKGNALKGDALKSDVRSSDGASSGDAKQEQNLKQNQKQNQKQSQKQSQEQLRAKAIERAIGYFYENHAANTSNKAGKIASRYHLDLHTAIRGSCFEKFAISPFLHGTPYQKKLLIWLDNFAVNALLLANAPTKALSYFSSRRFGAHALTIELGKARAFGQNTMADFTDITASISNILQNIPLKISDYRPEQFQVFKTAQVINKHSNAFTLNFDDDVKNFTTFERGSVLATDTNQRFSVQQAEEAVVFPNANVAIGQRALLTVVQCKNIDVV